jgi:hypothetical protein
MLALSVSRHFRRNGLCMMHRNQKTLFYMTVVAVVFSR